MNSSGWNEHGRSQRQFWLIKPSLDLVETV